MGDRLFWYVTSNLCRLSLLPFVKQKHEYQLWSWEIIIHGDGECSQYIAVYMRIHWLRMIGLVKTQKNILSAAVWCCASHEPGELLQWQFYDNSTANIGMALVLSVLFSLSLVVVVIVVLAATATYNLLTFWLPRYRPQNIFAIWHVAALSHILYYTIL